MEEALELAHAKDTKERMAGVERLHQLLEASRKSLSSSEVTSLVDVCLDLLKDNNFRVCQGALQSLDSAAVLSGEHFKLHFNALVPAVVERLGDAKQPVRNAARRLLLTLMQVSSPTIIVERAGSYAWMHRSFRVREEFACTVTSAIGLFASTELPLQRAILPPILQMLSDPNPGVRDAAISCIEHMLERRDPLSVRGPGPLTIKCNNTVIREEQCRRKTDHFKFADFIWCRSIADAIVRFSECGCRTLFIDSNNS
ncbi:CLIP-associated protein [Capsicum chinense]|nr:CLIP-associated protein [Capsicum chinense]